VAVASLGLTFALAVITYSSGNHARGMARRASSARRGHRDCPRCGSAARVGRRRFGRRGRTASDERQQAEALARAISRSSRRSTTIDHRRPGNDRLELVEDQADPAVVLVPIGGGLASGVDRDQGADRRSA
jgi:hypothetical protein